MNLYHRQNPATSYGVLIVLALLMGLGAVLLASGCSSWQGIDVKIRPGGKIHPDETVQPPTPPPPPQDDWAPPWFRRQKPEGRHATD